MMARPALGVMLVLLIVTSFALTFEDGTGTGTDQIRAKRFYRRCRGKIAYDYCKRECKCRNGRLYDCHRVRREFTAMSIAERKAYIRAVKIASTHPRLKPEYEKLLTIHRTYFERQIHEFIYFLPWHRWFILQYENLLRRVSCRITVPYWDYTLTAGAPFTSALWATTDAAIGGDGEGFPVPCVQTGPFRKGKWSLIASAGGGCLARSFIRDSFPDMIALAQLHATFPSAENHLRDFELMVRNDFHNNLHFFIGGFGGTMNSLDSAAAPEFFLLHAMVDKIWADWQKKSIRHVYVPEFLYQTAKMPGTEYFSRDFLNLSKQPRCTAVKYAEPGKKWESFLGKVRKVAARGSSVVRQIARSDFTKLRKKVLTFFKVSHAEIERLKVLHAQFKPAVTLNVTSLHGVNRQLGFKMEKVNQMVSG